MKRFSALAPVWTVAVCCLSFCPALRGAPPATPEGDDQNPQPGAQRANDFIRVARNAQQQPVALEISTVRFIKQVLRDRVEEGVVVKRKIPIAVDLISAVHIGDRPYYQKLNQQFGTYDVVLYELVADKDSRTPPKGQRPDDLTALLRLTMNVALRLDHQLDHIDYQKKNLVHADLSPAEMAAAIQKRGDDLSTIALGVLADAIRRQNLAGQAGAARPQEEMNLLAAFTEPDGPLKLKRLLAEQLAAPGAAGGLGRTLDEILIADRNQAAIRVLHEQLDMGHEKLAIFYGAGHMSDFSERLREIGFQQDAVTWTTAWNLKSPKSELFGLLKLLQTLTK